MKKPEIIFIVGNSRSGTTMMGRVLSLQGEIFTFHELHFFEQLWSGKDKQQPLSFEKAVTLHSKLLKNQRSGYLSQDSTTKYAEESGSILSKNSEGFFSHQLFKLFLTNESKINNKKIPCEQTPRNILYINDILSLYDNAKVIIMVRDPRDVLLSQKRKWKRKFLGAENIPFFESLRSWVNYHPITISKLWKINFSILQKFSKHPSVMVVKFEDFITQPQQKLEVICKFLNVNFDPKMLSVPVVGSSNTKDNVTYGISSTAAGNWDKGGLSSSEIFLCQHICKSGMSQLHYLQAPIKSNLFQIGRDIFSLPFKLIMAFGFNIKRTKNIRESLYRRLSTK